MVNALPQVGEATAPSAGVAPPVASQTLSRGGRATYRVTSGPSLYSAGSADVAQW